MAQKLHGEAFGDLTLLRVGLHGTCCPQCLVASDSILHHRNALILGIGKDSRWQKIDLLAAICRAMILVS
jgi:hypothetical protein